MELTSQQKLMQRLSPPSTGLLSGILACFGFWTPVMFPLSPQSICIFPKVTGQPSRGPSPQLPFPLQRKWTLLYSSILYSHSAPLHTILLYHTMLNNIIYIYICIYCILYIIYSFTVDYILTVHYILNTGYRTLPSYFGLY